MRLNKRQQKLVENNQGLIHAVIKTMPSKLYAKLLRFMEPEDIEQLGAIGLIKAAHGFNPKHGTKFSTYAWKCIALYLTEKKATARRIRWFTKCEDNRSPLSWSILDETPHEERTSDVLDRLDFIERSVPRIRNPKQRGIVKMICDGMTAREISDAIGTHRNYVGQTFRPHAKRIREEYLAQAI